MAYENWRKNEQNGKFIKNGNVGFTKTFNSPTFSNISLMGNKYAKYISVAGVTYTLHCTRGVNISVYGIRVKYRKETMDYEKK